MLYSPGMDQIAYSYSRFSTLAQEPGDSLRRQLAMAEDYCKKHNLQLHPVTYRDLGVSAFKRKNIEKGAMAAFLSAVKSGAVPKGSYLVIEQFDRLTRADVDVAVALLLNLVHAGIKVVTLADEKVWDQDSVRNMENLILAVIWMARANNESVVKSDRLKRKWAARRETLKASPKALKASAACPTWLEPLPDGSGYALKPNAASIVKVFEMRASGFGITSIVTRANREGWPATGKTDSWRTSLVGRLLKNRAVLGEYQPLMELKDEKIKACDPIVGRYPPAISEELWLRAQAKAERSGPFPGRRDASLKNWLQGLVKCNCGASSQRKNKHNRKQMGYGLYCCTSRMRGLTACPSLNAALLEKATLWVVVYHAPQMLDASGRADALRSEVDGLEATLGEATKVRERYLDAIGDGSAAVASILPRLAKAEAEVEDATRKLQAARAQATQYVSDPLAIVKEVRRLAEAISTEDERAQLRENVARVLERITLHVAEGYASYKLRGEDVELEVPLRKDATLPELDIEWDEEGSEA